MKKTIHVFDVDGTIIYGDSLLQIWQFANQSFWKMLSQLVSILPHLMVGKHQKAKEKLLAKLFFGKTKKEMETIGQQFFEQVLKYKLRPQAIEKFIELNEQKIPTILLSASCDVWLQPLATYLSANLLCTELAFQEQKFSGKFATPNCKGQEKIIRLLEKYPSADYEFICYGNSKSDKKLEPISKTFYYRYF